MKKITIKEAAERMGVSQQFVRIGLQRNLLDIGVAIKLSGNRYTYSIFPERFEALYGKSEREG